MAGWCEEAVALLRRPAVAEMAVDVLLCAVPIWAAVMIGLVVGWSWRPRWTGLLFLGLRSRLRILWVPPGFGARRLWLACTALSAFSVAPSLLSSAFRRCRGKHQGKECPEDDSADGAVADAAACADARAIFEGEHDIVTEKDLEHLLQLLDNKESGDTTWQHLMERTTSNMTYRAWRREPEVGLNESIKNQFWEDLDSMVSGIPISEKLFIGGDLNGHVGTSNVGFERVHGGFGYGSRNQEGVDILNWALAYDLRFVRRIQETEIEEALKRMKSGKAMGPDGIPIEMGPIMYCSHTIFEDATPELVRDFFWDGDFRRKWDPMLAYSKTLDEFPKNGTTIVHWIKKFPFFCSDREYIFGGRIWESGKTYYCVTKGVPYPSLPKKEKPRRVELYFSSWRIRAVQSPKHPGHQSACEVTLVHYEDMGIPKDVAKVGVRHGMWGAVKKLQSGFRAYQQMRDTENTLSRSAIMARVTTKTCIAGSDDLFGQGLAGANKTSDDNDGSRTVQHGFDWKWVMIGGAVAAVCVLNTGLVGKVLLLGAARRQAKK
ncbi:hypothetical protein PR202_gb12506 [Eleusine coracana subsp. coracana]|uniref:START domain-containing protein n=1 Tax=Eleusine coracana subsp. coracana TaxID=191504 RepID=A0AAV5EQM1_ELECO|nr:hypothetical protein PR202_gb12506 [Eleusine coracana subsp. coracana]